MLTFKIWKPYQCQEQIQQRCEEKWDKTNKITSPMNSDKSRLKIYNFVTVAYSLVTGCQEIPWYIFKIYN